MIIKQKDKNQEQVDYLSDLLERDLPEDKKRYIEQELQSLYSGDQEEMSCSYYLDIEFEGSDDWALIHDLRIKHNDRSVQIDHLLISRAMDIYVIESKNFNSGVAISDEGSFSYFYKDKPYEIESPIVQNERNIELLKQFLVDNDLLPKRLGAALKPNYKNIVLISPNSRLTKPKKGLFNCSAVMKSDKFSNYYQKDLSSDALNTLLTITKVISVTSLRNFSEKLSILHEQLVVDYSAKFAITNEGSNEQSTPRCPKCKNDMVMREVKKGKNLGKQFWGCSRYPKCDGTVEIQESEEIVENAVDISSVSNDQETPNCPECNKLMVKRTSTKGSTKGNEFWGCSDFPKCKATLKLSSTRHNNDIDPTTVEDETPVCPKCNAAMVKRSAKKGDTAGKEFWGCSKFPKCKGVVSI